MHRIVLFIIVLFGSWNSLTAASFPFTDVLPTDNYYEGVKSLYDYGIITNNGDNLFRPNDPITRDVFVGLATSVSCKKCLIPSTEDIIRYQVSPFIDLKKSNPNYYCIAYASEKKIVQGYNIPNLDGNFACQNNSNYSSPPFCDANNTTRIEAVAMLLRQAGLWNDIKNTNYTPNIDITDVSTYWRGYAEKGIQAQILTVKDEKKVYPDEIISRGEFANMASKILAYNQCSPEKDTSSIASDMIVIDSSGKTIEKTEFDRGTSDALSVVGGSGNWLKKWTLTNPITGDVLIGDGDTYPLKDVGTGKWIAKVELIDPEDKQVVSTATSTIFIRTNEQENKTGLSINIDGKPLAVAVGGSIDFSAKVYGGTGGLTYAWNFGDGNTSNITGNTRHIYNVPGSYRVTLTVTDRDGNTSQSTLIVSVGGNIDTDKDGIYDADDLCPYVFGIFTNQGCPRINTNNYTDAIQDLLAGSNISTIQPHINSVASDMIVIDIDGQTIKKTVFPIGATDSLGVLGTAGDWGKSWKLTHVTTGDIFTGNADTYPLKNLSIGQWIAQVDLIDTISGNSVSTATSTIEIKQTTEPNYTALTVNIEAKPLSIPVGGEVHLASTVIGSNNTTTYTWNFGDGTTSQESGSTKHTYTKPGTYTVTLIVKNTDGNTSQSSLVITVGADTDTDTDGIYDHNDLCLSTIGNKEQNGCPNQSLLSGIHANTCLLNHQGTQGLVIGVPECDTCPCKTHVDILASMRSCDIIFPSILSPDQKSIYIRGGFYQLP